MTTTPPAAAFSYSTPDSPNSNPTPDPAGAFTAPVCSSPANPCDSFKLTVKLPAGYAAAHPLDHIHIETKWDHPPAGAANGDNDVYVYRGDQGDLDGTQDAPFKSASGADPEVVDIPVEEGTAGTSVYTIKIVPFTAVPGENTKTTITFVHVNPSTSGPDADGDGIQDSDDKCPNTPVGTRVHSDGCPGLPRYLNYHSPAGVANDAGEPSVGCNWKTEVTNTNTNVDETINNILNGGTENYYGGFMTTLLSGAFNDCSSPATVTWRETGLILASTTRALGDPILFTDPTLGRTWIIQLEPGAGATMEYTDDDGVSGTTPSTGPAIAANDFDHETLGSGPYHALPGGTPFPTNPVFPHAVYYASQGVSEAVSFRSDDGGTTFNAKVPMYSANTCTGLHGHVKVSPADGTVYVPPKGCNTSAPPILFGGNAAVAVSEDNGLTWNVRIVPDATAATDLQSDASVGVATDGTVYLGFPGLDGHPRITVSHDKGVTWTKPYDVSNIVGGGTIMNVRFPEVVAGDPDRAAFAFFGTTTAGDGNAYTAGSEDDPSKTFPGTWYLYIATTIDGGAHWMTVNASPGDPIQRGPICTSGTCRNLLDFFDAQVDKEGRLILGGEDGCVTDACINGSSPKNNDWTAKAFITRQVGGKRLFKAFDPKDATHASEPLRPQAPLLDGGLNADRTQANLNWSVPDDGNAPITGYNVYKRVGTTGGFTKIGSDLIVNNFTDTAFDNSKQNFYHVTATNSQGEGPYCRNFTPSFVIPPDPCKLPGVLVISDLDASGADNDSGANTPPDANTNVRQLFIAELDPGPGKPPQLTFTLQTGASTNGASPNSEWFIIWNRKVPDADFDRYYVAMRTDATGAPTFEYGKWGVPLDTSIPPAGENPNANTPSKLGDADSGSFDPATGLIRIVVSNSKLENLAAGDVMPALNVRSFAGRNGVPGQRSQNNASDITDNSSYTLQGALHCRVNTPPTALLIGSTGSGPSPLTVSFTVAGSDADPGDSISKYTLQFGDESTKNFAPGDTLTVDHVYENDGVYTATLRVEDTHGAPSESTPASVFVVTVGTPPAATPGNNVLGGALPWLTFVVLGGLGALRRRRRDRP